MEILFYMKNKCLYKLEYMICLCYELAANKQSFNAWIGEGSSFLWAEQSCNRSHK